MRVGVHLREEAIVGVGVVTKPHITRKYGVWTAHFDVATPGRWMTSALRFARDRNDDKYALVSRFHRTNPSF